MPCIRTTTILFTVLSFTASIGAQQTVEEDGIRTLTLLPLPASATPSSPPLLNTIIASASSSPINPSLFTFPSPLPAGVVKTASGKPIPCSPKNTKLNPSTHKLISECTSQAFCLAQPGSLPNATGLGVCVPRLCRQDEYPFGYGHFGGSNNPPKIRVKGKLVNNDTIALPPMCPSGSFCPDNGSGCRTTLDLGGKCELGRDEQCTSPPPDTLLPPGSNRAICLNSKCMFATQGINMPCTIENTTYVSDIDKGLAGGGEFTSVIVKHDCLSPFFFCDTKSPYRDGSSPTCQRTKRVGMTCTFDAECALGNCESSRCAVRPGTPSRIAPWHWVAIVLFVLIATASVVLVLALIHRRRRHANYQALQEYYHEQMSYRRAIVALHTTPVGDYSHPKEKEEKGHAGSEES